MKFFALFALSLVVGTAQAAPVKEVTDAAEIRPDIPYHNGPNLYWVKREESPTESLHKELFDTEPAYYNGPKTFWARKVLPASLVTMFEL
ncbi:hypothetical protein BKA70DRAFT_1457222 [Coprinopsis sp. MPI-PUGE-AT-0042]|nr:hypothetical protein BKA70DRAFT_1457222 [Coprinopsis sp. MPI-PUGE-AT-0042]